MDILFVNSTHEITNIPDSKVYGANVGPTWGRQDPVWLHVGSMNLAIWDVLTTSPIMKFIPETIDFHEVKTRKPNTLLDINTGRKTDNDRMERSLEGWMDECVYIERNKLTMFSFIPLLSEYQVWILSYCPVPSDRTWNVYYCETLISALCIAVIFFIRI